MEIDFWASLIILDWHWGGLFIIIYPLFDIISIILTLFSPKLLFRKYIIWLFSGPVGQKAEFVYFLRFTAVLYFSSGATRN